MLNLFGITDRPESTKGFTGRPKEEDTFKAETAYNTHSDLVWGISS
jgi:hypothetical protein